MTSKLMSSALSSDEMFVLKAALTNSDEQSGLGPTFASINIY